MNPFNYKNIKQTTLIGIMASQLMSASAYAEELSPLVVTAGRVAENPANISSDTTVISRANIEDSQATTVADILRLQTGIDVASNGGLGKTTSVYIRGGNSGHTLVLIDGVRVGSATLGSFNWANLATADIERIEIVRGAQSSIYGADAMSGVIQIFTRKGTEGIHTQVFAEAGTYGTKSGGVSVQGGAERGLTYALSADTLRTDGFSAAVNGNEPDAYQRTTLSARIDIELSKGNLEFILRNTEANSDLDGGFPFADVFNYKSKTTQSVSSAKFSYPVSDSFESTLQISRSIDDAVDSDPVTAWNNADFKTTINQLTWQNHLDADTTSILFGLDIHQDTAVSQNAGFDKSIKQQAGFISASQSLDLFNWNASVRYDNNSVTSNQTTYKLGSVFHFSEKLSFSTNYGTGFKAPSINDLYFPDNFGSHGNPDLKPETSKGWDIGINYNLQQQSFRANFGLIYFSQSFKDLITWVETPVGSFAYIPANIDSASTKGMELEATLEHTLGFIRANWTSLDATDDSSRKQLVLRAKDSGSITLGTDISGVRAEVQTNIVGSRFSDPKNTKALNKYQKVDVRLSYAINPTWKAKFRIENLLDKTYEEVSGYGVAGRSTYAGINATF